MKTRVFDLSGRTDKSAVIEQLAYVFWIKEDEVRDELLDFYDTFDWRLFKQAKVLSGNGNRICLRNLGGYDIAHDLEFEGPPIFTRDLPDGRLKSVLMPLTGVRALMSRASVQIGTTSYRVMNEDAKTVAWLVVEELIAPTGRNRTDPTTSVNVQPVRGYRKYTKRVAKCLREMGLSEPENGDLFYRAMEATGTRPGDYSGAIDIALSPGMRAGEAAKTILRELYRAMRTNEAYIKHDIDTEFLHDYRVSVRRTRSLLGQLKSALPKAEVDRFRTDFARIGRMTNQLRDLDVYLLSESAYRDRMPPTMRDALVPLFDQMREWRAEALRSVVDGLESEEYLRTIDDWEAFLDESYSTASEVKVADDPIINVARRRIYRRYRRVVKGGDEILANTQDELLHVLRLEAKKLRYLMEFFASLFPRKRMRKLIRQLKRLQDNLGTFNDLEVQQKTLLHMAGELPLGDPHTREALIATGYLVDMLNHEQRTVKASFAETFRQFSSPANQKQFRQMFSVKGKDVAS